MISQRRAHTTLPVRDLDRARAFWEGRLGFTVHDVQPTAVMYKAGEGSIFAATLSSGTPTGGTQMGFTVSDIEAEVADLKARGIVFEEYDLPNFKTVDGIAPVGPNRGAWFKDSEGNLIGLVEFA